MHCKGDLGSEHNISKEFEVKGTGVVLHDYDPCYLGCGDQENFSSRSSGSGL
jgi:hypothetical protein